VRTEPFCSGVTRETTAVGGSSALTPSVGSTVSLIGMPVAAQGDSTRAGRPITAGKNRVPSAHHVYNCLPSMLNLYGVARRVSPHPTIRPSSSYSVSFQPATARWTRSVGSPAAAVSSAMVTGLPRDRRRSSARQSPGVVRALMAWPTLPIQPIGEIRKWGIGAHGCAPFRIQSRLKGLAGAKPQLLSPDVIHLPSATPSCVGPAGALGLDWWARY